MLTQTTAKEVGITKRTDPRQSIEGGSIYFHRLLERFPESIPRQDKLWMTIAAYNLGFTYLKEARKLALIMNKNPNRWNDVRESLLALKTKDKDSQTNIMINEALDYVQKIQLYYHTLSVLSRCSETLLTNS